MKIIADLELCQGHGMCASEAPEVFRVVESEDGSYSHVEILVPRLDEALREKVETAIRVCPNRTLSLKP
jgi:ferredoxin